MAEAVATAPAPASPSTPATPSAPAAPSAASGGAATSAAPPSGPGDPVGAVGKQGAPIRPIPQRASRLPGVFDDDAFPPASTLAPPSASEGSALPPRGPDGRFVASPSSATPPHGVEHTLEPSAPDAPPTPTKFKFLGQEYESQEAAEQQVRSLRGQYKPIQSLARELGGLDKIPTALRGAAESARGWKAEAERLSAELAAARNGSPVGQPPAASPTTPTESAAEAADVDWDLYAEVKKLATEAGEPWKAEQWLISEVRKVERAHAERLINEHTAPFKQQQAKQVLAQQVDTLFGSLADYTNEDGSPSFPELHNEQAAAEIGELWANMKLPREAALTPQGALAAIALYRMYVAGWVPPQARTAPAPPPTAPPPASPPAPTDTASAAGLDDGRPTSASVPGGSATPSPEAARILAGLRRTHNSNRAHLGFEA